MIQSITKIFKVIFGINIFILFFIFGCGAPKLDDDFLREEGEPGSSDSFIVEEIPDSSVIKRIDSLNLEIASLENLFKRISEHDLLLKIDSLLKEINEIKRNVSVPFQKDYSKLDSLEKESLNQSNKIKKLEEKIKSISEKKGITVPKSDKNQASSIKTNSDEINTFDDFNTNYDYALSLYNQKRFDEALKIFSNLLNSRLQKPDLIDNIYFWMGECSFQKNDLDNAINNFKNVLAQPKSNKSEDALWKLGLIYEKLNKIEEAREYFQRLIDTFPKSRYLNRAKNKLKTLI